MKGDEGFTIQRQAVFVGNEKRVPIYLESIYYLKIDHKDVHDIDYKKKFAKDLIIKQAEVSMQGTAGDLCKAIKKL